MMDFDNTSPFPALAYDVEDAAGEMFDVVVARGTFALVASPPSEAGSGGALTHRLVPLEEQEAIVVSDAYFGEVNRSSVRFESDLAMGKPMCDVVILGSAHSPTGEAVPQIEVGIAVERAEELPGIPHHGTLLAHRLVVCGPRAFVRGKAAEGARLAGPGEDGWSLTEPEPVATLPLRYEHAFGGELRVHAEDEAAQSLDAKHRLSDEVRAKHPDGPKAPIAHTACLHNPVGVGFLEAWYADALAVDRWPAPQIEAAGHPITAKAWTALVRGEKRPGDEPALAPQGVGVIAKPWSPRLALAGTFDAKWLETTWPRMPADFDMAYWNGAHPRMQCPHLFGGERVTLSNVAAPGTAPLEGDRSVIRFEIPDVNAAVRLKTRAGQTGWGGLTIDTLIIDAEARTVSVVWRLSLPHSLDVDTAIFTATDARRRAA